METGVNYLLGLIVLFLFFSFFLFYWKTNVTDGKEFIIKQMPINIFLSSSVWKAMNIFPTIPLQQMFCLIYIHFIHCLTFDLSFEGIHRRECHYLSTCCASICLCSARITTNYISFVKIWMTEAFLRLHIHGMIRCYLLVLEELFIPYLDTQTRNSCQICTWVSSVSTEIFYQKSVLDAFPSPLFSSFFLTGKMR